MFSGREALVIGPLLVFNTVYLVQALDMPTPFEAGEPGPAFFPLVLCALIYVSSFGVMFSRRADGDADAGDGGSGDEMPADGKSIRPFLAIGATALFIFMLDTFGYWLSTFIYALTINIIFEYSSGENMRRVGALAVLVSAALTVLGWLFFVKLFDLHLPTGVIWHAG